MKYLNFFILNFALFLIGCQHRTERNQAQIIGEWQSVEPDYMVSYRFEENEICYKTPGFFEYKDSTMPTVENPYSHAGSNEPDITAMFGNIMRFHRSHSCYKIENNYLKIYNPAIKTWDISYISFITNDALVLSNKDKTRQYKFRRKQSHCENNSPLFDQILIYCPPMDLISHRYYSIHSNGTLLIYGENGYFNNFIPATIEKDFFERLEILFRQANIESYLEAFNVAELSKIPSDKPYIVFLHKNKKYVFNCDFNQIHPRDLNNFYRACFSTLFHMQEAKFQPQMDHARMFFTYYFENMHLWEIDGKGSKIGLSELEMFYLASLLSNAVETDETFLPLYIAKGEYPHQNIVTDGQFFTYWEPYAGERTVDLGFNFMEKNDLTNHLLQSAQNCLPHAAK